MSKLETKVMGQRGSYEVFHKTINNMIKYEVALEKQKPYFFKAKR